MEEIRGDEFMYIGSWKVIGEGLTGASKVLETGIGDKSYDYIGNNAVFTPQNWNFICVDQCFCDISCASSVILVFIIQIFMKRSTSREFN
jgi:hypothetical protein